MSCRKDFLICRRATILHSLPNYFSAEYRIGYASKPCLLPLPKFGDRLDRTMEMIVTSACGAKALSRIERV